ncbi:glycoside hydrolase family 10 protein [Erwinia sp. P6884]|uniref:glycoside hydrolase family 10 protein n=1 Tax=Erwinia sp. P6884 TaxID=3141450 RepID=UPI0031985594
MMLTIRKSGGWLLLAVLLAVSGCSKIPEKEKRPQPVTQVKPVRGIWLATVTGLDWPPAASLKPETAEARIRIQKQGLTDALDEMVKTGINTVFFQVKPDGTALWRSDILPWSDVLTGFVGKDPGYDPLAFMLKEAHKRGIKVHAWLNPYRVSMNTRQHTIEALNHTLLSTPASVYALHPDWIRTASHRFVLDPGLPEVRNWIASIVTEIIKNYDVDGIQFDDYFYYETPQSPLDDESTWRKYGKGFSDKPSWRRNNTLMLIKQVSSVVRTLKPGTAFGISPAGVWRNKADDPEGSDTRGGGPSYDTAYADTRQWVKLGLLDYIAPQLYWPFDREIVRYDVLIRWWSDVVKETPVRLYPGIALYKVGVSSATEPAWTVDGGVPELKRELDLNDALPEVGGAILFSQRYLNQPQTDKAVEYLRTRWKTGQ